MKSEIVDSRVVEEKTKCMLRSNAGTVSQSRDRSEDREELQESARKFPVQALRAVASK